MLGKTVSRCLGALDFSIIITHGDWVGNRMRVGGSFCFGCGYRCFNYCYPAVLTVILV
jgi:hypothetical protein